MVQTNFRAGDHLHSNDGKMKSAKSKRDRAPRLAAPEPTSKPVPQEVDENEVPSGTVPEILTWVGEDAERAQKALDVEVADEKPRKGLVKSLTELINSEAGDETPVDEDDESVSVEADDSVEAKTKDTVSQ